MFQFAYIGIAAGAASVVDMPADVSANKAVAAPAGATASITFKRDGTITNQAGTVVGTWITPNNPTIGDSYDVKHTRSGGTAFSSAAAADNTYIAMTADRTYSDTISSGTKTTIGTWSISLTGVGVALDTATSTIVAESS